MEGTPPSKKNTLSTIFRRRKVTFDHMVTADVAMKQALTAASRVARTDTAMLLRGEAGTGKSLLAQAIHNASPRRSLPFVVVGPGDASGEGVRERLFGEGSAPGIVELAQGGTLVLDDLQDWPASSQVLAEQLVDFREYIPSKGVQPVHFDVRLLATLTDAPGGGGDVPSTVSRGLYQRLRGCEIVLPPLSARRQDLDLLAKEFLRRFVESMGCEPVSLSDEAIEVLRERRWYGNVRELDHTIRGAAIQALEQGRIRPEHLPSALRMETTASTLPFRVDEMERLTYQRALEAANGNRKKAIHLLGVAPSTFYRKARAFGLVSKDENEAQE